MLYFIFIFYPSVVFSITIFSYLIVFICLFGASISLSFFKFFGTILTWKSIQFAFFFHFKNCSKMQITYNLLSHPLKISSCIKYTHTVSYNCQHHPSSEVLSSCKAETLYPLSNKSPFPHTPSTWRGSFYFLSLWFWQI